LKNLPPGTFGGPTLPLNDPRANRVRNLTRAKVVKLAAGRQMATFLNGKGVNLTKVTRAQIRNGNLEGWVDVGGRHLGGRRWRDSASLRRPCYVASVRPPAHPERRPSLSLAARQTTEAEA
jgi:hypothetical protein